MSGHSKWANIKRKKGAIDAQRGKIFTKIGREIMVAARQGGGDPDSNPRLRLALLKARAANMSADTIERGIKKGTGTLEGVEYEEITYEGYGPAGVAILVETLTDNRKRTVSEMRYLFTRHNGNLGETGCVSWIFNMKSYFVFARTATDADRLVEVALDSGAEDIHEDESDIEVTAPPEAFTRMKENFEKAGLTPTTAEVTMVPQNTIRLEGKEAEQALRLVEAIEDNDDVQRVHANFDISEEVMESL